MARRCRQAGLVNEPSWVLEVVGEMRAVDVVLASHLEPEKRRWCNNRPTDHQAILFQRFQFRLPQKLIYREIK